MIINRLFFFIFTTFYFNFSIFSKSFVEPLNYNNQTIKISLGEKKGSQVTKVHLEKKLLYSTERALIGESFSRATLHKNLLFLIFEKGAHGESIFVFSLKKRKIVFSKNASWPISIKRKGKHIKLIWQEDGDEFGDYQNYHKEF